MAIYVTMYHSMRFLIKPAKKKLTTFYYVDWSHEVVTQEGAEQFVHDIGFNSGFRRVSASEYVSKPNGFGEQAFLVVEENEHRGERATVEMQNGSVVFLNKKEG